MDLDFNLFSVNCSGLCFESFVSHNKFYTVYLFCVFVFLFLFNLLSVHWCRKNICIKFSMHDVSYAPGFFTRVVPACSLWIQHALSCSLCSHDLRKRIY